MLNKDILDDPKLLPELFVLWVWNGKPWPAADRRLAYLSFTQTDAMRGFALFTMDWRDAAIFVSVEEANAFLKGHNSKRPHPYTGVNLTTVEDLRKQLQYPERKAP
jgi:hypothetical protein